VGSLPPEWGGPVRGGAATFHAALLTRLLEADAGVEVVGTLPPGPLEREIPVPAWIRPDDVSRGRFYEQVLERSRPEVVLMNHVAHAIGVTHARLGSPVPALGVIQSWHNVTFRSGEERRRALEVTQEALNGLGVMVAVSHHTMAEGRGLGFECPARAETIHNPVPPLYMEKDLDLRAAERRGALFLGSLIPRKEPVALVEATALLPELSVLLVGQGELEEELRGRIDALGLADRVRLAEPPPGDGHLPWVRKRLLHSQAMCLPSRSEGLPLSFVEALACGTPVVGFGPSVREIRDEVGIEVGEPLDHGTPEEIAAALEKVLATEWDREGLREATISAFGLDRAADRYLELLAAIAAPREPADPSSPAPA
jgi:glycosyltransferase involved in cell wall biosynthesis